MLDESSVFVGQVLRQSMGKKLGGPPPHMVIHQMPKHNVYEDFMQNNSGHP